MSVLMGCGKKMTKQKSSSKIQSSKPLQKPAVNEPTSDAKRSVWCLNLDGKKVILTMNKETKQVQSDGKPVSTFEGHFEGEMEGEEDDFSDDQDILDFTIFVATTSSEHKGRLLKVQKAIDYQLFVDGEFVPENLPTQESEFPKSRAQLDGAAVKRSFSLDAGDA